MIRRWPESFALIVNVGSASDFANSLSAAFHREAAAVPFSEVQQFRALMRAFARLRRRFHLEEYHGAKHQVLFNGAGTWARAPARCELCDVVFVTYRSSPAVEVRISFLQAKLSKDNHPDLCQNYPTKLDFVEFNGNLEQWDLLARRPEILPVPPFRIHPLALQNATLPSVGSFGVFHRTRGAGTEFFYSAADQLSPVGSPRTKFGRLVTTANALRQRTVAGHSEDAYCCCLSTFAESLYSLRIGTPLDVAPATAKYDPLVSWLRSTLERYTQSANADSVRARELLDILPRTDFPRDDDDGRSALPTLVLIKGAGSGDSGDQD